MILNKRSASYSKGDCHFHKEDFHLFSFCMHLTFAFVNIYYKLDINKILFVILKALQSKLESEAKKEEKKLQQIEKQFQVNNQCN